MQSVSSRIWTRVAVSNSYDDNDYTTGTMMKAKNLPKHSKEKQHLFQRPDEVLLKPKRFNVHFLL